MKFSYLLMLMLMLGGCWGQQKDKQGNSGKHYPEKSLPEFEMSEEIHNFGTLRAGEIAVYTFTFKNSGNGILEIQNVESGCGCLTVEPEVRILKPGETGRIKVIFNTEGLYGDQFQAFRVLSSREGIGKNLAVAAKVINNDIELKQQ